MNRWGLLFCGAFLSSGLARAEEKALSLSDVKIQLNQKVYGPSTPLLKTDDTLYEPRYLEENPSGIAEFNSYTYSVPVQATSGTKLFHANHLLNDLDDKDLVRGTGAYLIRIPISGPQQCTELLAISEEMESQSYDLCLYVSPKSLDTFNASTGPFAYRKPFGVWAFFSTGALTQIIDNPTQASSALSAKEISIRAGAGVWWHNLQGDVAYRRKVVDIGNAASINPTWIDVYLSYGFEMAKLKNWVVHVSPVMGWEYYKNSVTNPIVSSRYITDYPAPTLGFRSRFIYKSRIEFGGEFIYALLQGSSKFLVQGDFRYWLDPKWAVGAGYWVDKASVQAGPAIFNETSLALELNTRYIF